MLLETLAKKLKDVFIRKKSVYLSRVLLLVISVIFNFLRSSSGFCEKFPGHGGSGPGRTEESQSAHIVDSASCYLDLNSNGDLVTRAMADLDLNSSIELLSGRMHDDNNQHFVMSCDTAELLRTPSPCMIESEQEAEVADDVSVGVEAEEDSSGERVEKDQDQQAQWAAIPATSTPKKRNASANPQIPEGTFKGSGYHRDGTKVGWYCTFNK